MPGSTRIRITSQEEYEWLDSVRENYGLTWRGMLLKAEQRLLAAERHWPEEFRTPEHLRAGNRVDADGDAELAGDAASETDEAVG
ncbi:hypothetical protein [Haloplanus halophilus]|uniref:hypothetical protein n=1 Tax=Haloplanus halophilus TaxID=2949993 RepID=UPI00204049BE|nr:hypothetical protein [Haloplanus sp. GDY1]